MTPKEKAKQLVEKFKDYVATDYQYDDMPLINCQKQSALICVDEILNFMGKGYANADNIVYYLQVKKEIQNI